MAFVDSLAENRTTESNLPVEVEDGDCTPDNADHETRSSNEMGNGCVTNENVPPTPVSTRKKGKNIRDDSKIDEYLQVS